MEERMPAVSSSTPTASPDRLGRLPLESLGRGLLYRPGLQLRRSCLVDGDATDLHQHVQHVEVLPSLDDQIV